ncbi:SDR family oxidoreductase [Amnibacterium kyonggiense]|uniref:Putative NAD(P)-binding protein n=1 Tax=Amnibacterium kyonggiense TaxID=595671 RepID=A0A4R7FKE3_9MICO|nr:SDR family oxidoreductase [Amnibacterium kyonggiense]TDS76807.1 putative NAD(P)-binding protein [Amnibacterium kyonggiense]
MSTVVIVGGHGKVALRLAEALTAQGRTVRSTIRNEAHGPDVERAGAEPYLLDIESSDAEDFAEVFGGADAVVFSAGGGGDGNVERKRTVDLEGSLKSIEAAGLVGIRRFVQVSAMGVDEPAADDAAPAWRAYVEAKRDADVALRGSGLDWTIVRPGGLTDDPATGSVRIAPRLSPGRISRSDVAAVIAAVLDDDATIGAQFELVEGEQTIAEALASLR